MPIYDYRCEACEHHWEQNLSVSNREAPCKEKCPECNKKGKVKKHVGGFPGIGCDMTLTPDKKTGGRWSEVMNKIKGELPEKYAKNMNNTDMSGHSWKG